MVGIHVGPTQRLPTLELISGWPNVMSSGRLLTMNGSTDVANVEPPFTFATGEPALRPPDKMTLDQPLLPI